MTDLLTFGGEEPGPGYGHVGYPPDPVEALERLKRGLPVYWPTDPRSIDQRPYVAFSEKRGPNSE